MVVYLISNDHTPVMMICSGDNNSPSVDRL